MSEPTLNLYQKIQAVMKDVAYLKKDGKVDFNKTKYNVITEEKVTTAVRDALIKYGLVILPVEQSHKREGTLSTVDTKYKIVDVESGECEYIVSSGTGVDTQDKGVGKAMTYSYKYLLLRSFAIPTGEDPDKISSAELDAKENEAITAEQVGILKKLALEYANMRGGTDAKVFQALKISDVTKLTSQQAQGHIDKVMEWIEMAKKKEET